MNERTIELGKANKVAYKESQLINIIESWKIVGSVGKAENLTVRTVNLYDDAKSEKPKPRYLVNLNCATEYGLNRAAQLAAEAIKEQDIEAATAKWQAALNCSQTASVFVNAETGEVSGYLPEKGEMVNCLFENFETKDGEVAIGIKANSLTKVKAIEFKSAKGLLAGLMAKFEENELDTVKHAAKQFKTQLQKS